MNRLRPSIAVLVVALVLLALAGIGTAVSPARRSGSLAPERVAVQSAAAVCPYPAASAGAVTTTLRAAVAPPDALGDDAPVPADATAGSAGLRPLDPKVATPSLSIPAPGLAGGIVVGDKGIGPILAQATGALAPGMTTEQFTRGMSGGLRGLAATTCAAPASRSWFVGAGSGVGQRSLVLLSNVDDRQAVVDLQLYGAGGRLETPAGRGIVVPAHSRTTLELASLAPAERVVAIHVVSREGRVASAVLDIDVDGLRPAGIEYLPPTERARKVVIPAVYPGAGLRQLNLLSPSADVEVRVQLLTPDGALAPVGLDTIELEAGKVARVDLTTVSKGQAVGLVLRAPTSIVAGLRAVLPGTYNEQLQVAGTPELTGPAVLSGIVGSSTSTSVVLAAPNGDGHVRIATYPPRSAAPAPDPVVKDVTVPAGSSLTVPLAIPAGSTWAWAVVTPLPGSGPVHATRVTAQATSTGPMATATPLLTQRAFATIPSPRYRVGTR